MILTQKHCPQCGETKDRSEFPKNKRTKDGFNCWCKSCCNKKTAAAYRADPTYLREYAIARHTRLMNEDPEYVKKNREGSKKWRDANPERQRQNLIRCRDNHRAKLANAEGSYTAQEWRDLLVEYGGRCAYCGSQTKLGPDHVVALSRGGTNYIENIVPACFDCNQSKNRTPLFVWLWRRLSHG